jgi:predicted metal-dependent HD superfamily phosphohydrolase
MNQQTLVQLYYGYRRPNRFFHNLDHIADGFKELREALQAGVHVDDEEAFRFAWWFHDYIYEGEFTDNEERSADSAYEAALREGYDEAFAQRVKRYILVTKHIDRFKPETNDEKLICDIDLTSLAVDHFAANTELIRKEYAFVPDAIFKIERKKILAAFNERKPIYHTPYFYDKYEVKAHLNLEEATK